MPNLSSMAASVADLLKQRQHTIAVTESSCGGLISAALVAVPGASAYYLGGATVYTRQAQKSLLRVPDTAMVDIRASSEPYALLNSRTVRESIGSTWALSETGASGPTGKSLRRSGGPRVFRRSGSGGARHHPRNGQRGPGRQYVGFRRGRVGAAGAVPARVRLT